MKSLLAQVRTVHVESTDDPKTQGYPAIQVELDGIVGSRHKSFVRSTFKGDKQPQGTTRRNERQWSAVSIEELVLIAETLELECSLSAAALGANLCLEGVPNLSGLPKGTLLRFPSGVELIVEEYNHPCHDMGRKLACMYTSQSGKPLSSTAFSKAAKLIRGIVGVVEVGGTINAGDEVSITRYESPSWLVGASDKARQELRRE